jgi:hypothetical protein
MESLPPETATTIGPSWSHQPWSLPAISKRLNNDLAPELQPLLEERSFIKGPLLFSGKDPTSPGLKA